MVTTERERTMNYFESATRDDGTVFVRLVDGAPDWVHKAVFEAHDGEMPNDWRYETCAALFATYADGVTDAGEAADALTDVYTADLLAWLDPGAIADIDSANEDLGRPGSFVDEIRQGQMWCIGRMAEIIYEAIDAWTGEVTA